MKRILALSLLVCSHVVCATESGSNGVTEATKNVVSGIVEFGKNLIEGADEGVDEGRKTGLSKDGALIVDNGAELATLLDVQLLTVSQENETDTAIEVGFKNGNDQPVRLINLNESENVIAIDQDGYATNLGRGNPQDLTIPSQAGKKQRFIFRMSADAVKEIRIMGQVFPR